MDPYLEAPQWWQDVHAALANAIRAQLQPKLRPRYIAALTPYVTYEDLTIAEVNNILPDVAILDHDIRPKGGMLVATASPYTATSLVEAMPVPSRTQRIEIRTVGSDELVTVIEILSPTNKRQGTDSHEAYLQKRRDLLQSKVHFLELDLLRRGERWPTQNPLPPGPYYALLSRVGRRPQVEVWPIGFYEPPQPIAVPLRVPDPDVTFDLGQALAQIYEEGAFELRIDYRQEPPLPPLTPEETARLNQLLQEAGLR
jgi:hypothetical protein